MKIADDLRLFCPSPVTTAEVSFVLPFVIPSEAEGSAVFSPRPLLEVFFDREKRSGEPALSEVEGDLLFLSVHPI